jgi:hypothetical protein
MERDDIEKLTDTEWFRDESKLALGANFDTELS